jgi:hypothetical protein
MIDKAGVPVAEDGHASENLADAAGLSMRWKV